MAYTKFDIPDFGAAARASGPSILGSLVDFQDRRRKIKHDDEADAIARADSGIRLADLDRRKADDATKVGEGRTAALTAFHTAAQGAKSHAEVQAAFDRSGARNYGMTLQQAIDESPSSQDAPAPSPYQGQEEPRKNALDALGEARNARPSYGPDSEMDDEPGPVDAGPIEPPPMKFDYSNPPAGAGRPLPPKPAPVAASAPEVAPAAPQAPVSAPLNARTLNPPRPAERPPEGYGMARVTGPDGEYTVNPNQVQNERNTSAGFFSKLGGFHPDLKLGGEVGASIVQAGGGAGSAQNAVMGLYGADQRAKDAEAKRLADAEALRARLAQSDTNSQRMANRPRGSGAPPGQSTADHRLVRGEIDKSSKLVDVTAASLMSARRAAAQLASGDQSLAFTSIGSQIKDITGALNDGDAKRLLEGLMSRGDKIQSAFAKETGGQAVSPEVMKMYLDGIRNIAIPHLERQFGGLQDAVYGSLANDPSVAKGARTAVDIARAKAGMAPYTDKDFAAYEARYRGTRSGTPAATPSGVPAGAKAKPKARAALDAILGGKP